MSKSYAIYNMDHSLLWYFVKQNIEENDLWCHNNANEVEAEKDDKLILNTVSFEALVTQRIVRYSATSILRKLWSCSKFDLG